MVGVAEGLQGSNDRGFTGVNTHRIDVLHRTDDGGVVRLITHHLVLKLLPAEDGFLNQHLRNTGVSQPKLGDFNEFTHVPCRTTAQATQGESGTNEDGPTANEFGSGDDFIDGIAGHGLADGEVDGFANLVEQFTVFRFVNGVQIRTDELDAQPFKRPVVGQLAGDVQGGLPAHAGQQSTRSLLLQYLGNGLGQQRLDVDDVGHLWVVLDGGRVGIDEDDLVAVLTQGPNGLGA